VFPASREYTSHCVALAEDHEILEVRLYKTVDDVALIVPVGFVIEQLAVAPPPVPVQSHWYEGPEAEIFPGLPCVHALIDGEQTPGTGLLIVIPALGVQFGVSFVPSLMAFVESTQCWMNRMPEPVGVYDPASGDVALTARADLEIKGKSVHGPVALVIE
jgi:hypothetical protein